QLALAAQVLEQRQGEVVAGHAARDAHLVVERRRQFAADVGGEVLDLRGEARTDARLGPQQLLGEFGESRGAPLVPVHERAAELRFLVLQVAPQVSVRQAECASGGGDRALVTNRAEYVEERVSQQRGGLARELVAELDADDPRGLMHGASYRCAAWVRLFSQTHV